MNRRRREQRFNLVLCLIFFVVLIFPTNPHAGPLSDWNWIWEGAAAIALCYVTSAARWLYVHKGES